MAKIKNIKSKNYRYIFSSGKRILRSMFKKIHFPKKKQRITNRSGVSDPLSARYRVSVDGIRTLK
ncbi:MAG: hypothetical protein ACFFDT_30805 [Candidatus Hodarchaeota archaeon]